MNETKELGGTVSQTFAVDAEEETGSRVYWFRSVKEYIWPIFEMGLESVSSLVRVWVGNIFVFHTLIFSRTTTFIFKFTFYLLILV